MANSWKRKTEALVGRRTFDSPGEKSNCGRKEKEEQGSALNSHRTDSRVAARGGDAKEK